MISKTELFGGPKLNSLEWCKHFDIKEYDILGPDGWIRSNYQYSFYEEEIGLNVFIRRLSASTILHNAKSHFAFSCERPSWYTFHVDDWRSE